MDYDGNSWEDLCDILLGLKHGHKYQPISDGGGDCGIDGLVISEGIAYQAYGQEMENQDPVKGLKDKIHKDLNKLFKYQNEIKAILGDEKIIAWNLLLNRTIPSNTIHEYIETKKQMVLGWKLSFIDDDFQVSVQEPSYLATEYLDLEKRRDKRIEVDITTSDAPALDALLDNENFKIVYDKFKIITDAETAKYLAYSEVKNYIENSIQLDEIQKREAEFYKEIEEVRSEVEEEAELGSMLSGEYANYSSIKNTLENRLNNKIGSRCGTQTLGRVRKFAIADWLVRCPLRFKKSTGEV